LSGSDAQRIGLSATVGEPAALLRWFCGRSERPCKVKKLKLLEFTGGCRMSAQFTKVGLNGT